MLCMQLYFEKRKQKSPALYLPTLAVYCLLCSAKLLRLFLSFSLSVSLPLFVCASLLLSLCLSVCHPCGAVALGYIPFNAISLIPYAVISSGQNAME